MSGGALVCLLLLVQGGGAVWHPNGPVWNPSDPTKVVGHIDYAPPHIGPWHRLPFRACASSAMWACWCVLVRAGACDACGACGACGRQQARSAGWAAVCDCAQGLPARPLDLPSRAGPFVLYCTSRLMRVRLRALSCAPVPTSLRDYDDNLNADETAIQEINHDVDHLRAADAYLESAMNRRGPQGPPGPLGAPGRPGEDAKGDDNKTPGPPGRPGPPGAMSEIEK